MIFEDRYGCVRQRHFDGSFLEFPGLSPEVDLYPYQKDAVARIIFSPNTLLAHDVGAGKTYVMIAAGQELRRMGLSKEHVCGPQQYSPAVAEYFPQDVPRGQTVVRRARIFRAEKTAGNPSDRSGTESLMA